MDSGPKQPSECFRWVIVLCSFISHAATAGVLLSLGVMYVSWLEEFQEPKGVTSWVLSLACSLHNGFSPVPANLAARYGFRVVSVVGGLLTFAGLVTSAFATSVTQLIITIGVITGVGSCFSYLPAVAIVPLYFDKRRSLATGIGTTGVGAGAFLLAPLVNYLIETYTWRGALLILGAMSLNLCACGLLFRPVDTRSMDDDDKGRKEEDGPVDEEEAESKLEQEHDAIIPNIIVELVDPDVTGHKLDNNKGYSEVSPSLAQMILLKSRLRIFDGNRMHQSLNDLRPTRTPITHSSFPNLNQPQNRKKSHESLIRSIRNLDAALLGSLNGFHILKEESEDKEMNKCLQTNVPGVQKHDIEGPTRNRSWVIRLLSFLGETTHLDALRDKYFLIFCISNFLACLSYYTPVVYLVDRAVHQGIDIATGAILISVSGCGTILGRILTGIVSDCCSNRLLSYAIALCTQGIGTMLSCLCGDNAILHIIYAAYLGFHMGIFAVLSPLVTIDLQGRSNIAKAYGVVLLFMGVATLIGAPISGWLFDWSRSYELSYIANGLFLVISGLIVIPLLCRQRANHNLEKV